MNNDKLCEAAGRIANQLSFDYGISAQRALNIIMGVMAPLFHAPEPVDDKVLAEALHITLEEMLDAETMERIGVSRDRDINTCLVRVCGELRGLSEGLRLHQIEAVQLREWKRQQLEVESSWDTQAVGKLLDVPLGKPIRPAIAPGIEALQAEVKELRATNDGPWNMISNIADTLRARGFEEGQVDERVIAMAQALDKARAAGDGK